MRARRTFAVLYLCSGAAGLIYEVVWTRTLTLQLGHTTAAVGTVLAAFMGGLAIGAGVGGRLTSRLDRERALRVYAALECAIAACAVAMPFALRALEPLFVAAYADQPTWTFAFVRLVSSFLLVSIPAVALGATFPVAVRWYARDASTARSEVGNLYALNTVGAAAGALATGFVLIPAVGLNATTLVGVALNIIAAGGAGLIASRQAEAPAASVPSRKTPPSRKTGHEPRRSSRHPAAAETAAPARWLPFALLALSGFVALVYEVAFTRVLALAVGPTTYAFAAMLTAFISGLAIGAAVAARLSKKDGNIAFTMGWLLLAVTAVGCTAAWFAGTRLPLLVARTVADSSAGASAILAREALYSVAVLLPLSCILGGIFPLGLALTVRSDQAVARDASVAYVLNTIGAVAGSLAAAFVLIPVLGLQNTIRAAGAAALGGACLTVVAGRLTSRQRRASLAGALAAGAILFVVPGWDLNLLSSGAYKYALDVRGGSGDLKTSLTAGTLLYYNEGATATVSVRRLASTVALAIDGKVDASNGTDMLTQKLLGHLPLLLHPNPRNVAVIGLGSGVTLGATLRHGIEQVDVVEISPEVVEASRFFDDVNGRALHDPRVRLMVSDGRSHLQLTSRQYDVLISEPSNPWMAGVASLFTREFFLAARARLTSGGIICQWAHTYDIAEADLRSIAATFASVFPGGTMWLVGDGDVLFVATNDSAGPVLENLQHAWQRTGVAADLDGSAVFDLFSLLSLYVAGPAELERFGRGALIQTDNRTALEFSGPLGVYDRRATDNAQLLKTLLADANAPSVVAAARTAAGAREWSNRGQMLLRARAYAAAFDSFSHALKLDPNYDPALTGVIDAAGAGRREVDAQQLLESLARAPGAGSGVRIALARLLAATGAFEPAAALAQGVIAAEPADPRGPELLASILSDAGDVDRLGPVVKAMQQTHPNREDTSYYAAMVSFLRGDFPDAIARAEQVVQANPRHALALNLIGSASASLGQRDRARQAFRASIEASPEESTTYANLGLLEMESGNRDAAARYFGESLALDPDNETVQRYLSAASLTEHQP